MEENKNMTAERSLEIITKSIEQSRKVLVSLSGKYFLLWGTAVIVTAIAVWLLWANTSFGSKWNIVWCPAMLATWGINYLMSKREEHLPDTFVTKTMGQIWAVFGIMAMALGVACSFMGVSVEHIGTGIIQPIVIFPITSIIILLFGLATAITGRVLDNMTITVSGFVAGLGGSVGSLFCFGPSQHLVLALSAFVALVVPGIIIQCKKG